MIVEAVDESNGHKKRKLRWRGWLDVDRVADEQRPRGTGVCWARICEGRATRERLIEGREVGRFGCFG